MRSSTFGVLRPGSPRFPTHTTMSLNGAMNVKSQPRSSALLTKCWCSCVFVVIGRFFVNYLVWLVLKVLSFVLFVLSDFGVLLDYYEKVCFGFFFFVITSNCAEVLTYFKLFTDLLFWYIFWVKIGEVFTRETIYNCLVSGKTSWRLRLTVCRGESNVAYQAREALNYKIAKKLTRA